MPAPIQPSHRPRRSFSALAISEGASRSGDRIGGLRDWLGSLESAGMAGIGAVQLREKSLDDRELYELAQLAHTLLPPTIPLLVNGRADLALAAGAEGVHLPADGVPAEALRARFGSRLLIGRSTHTLAEVAAAASQGIDYVTFGPVYPSPGKGEPTGIESLAAAARFGIPVFALGGVKIERLKEIAAAGAAGIAGIRCFQSPRELASLVPALRIHFGRAPEDVSAP